SLAICSLSACVNCDMSCPPLEPCQDGLARRRSTLRDGGGLRLSGGATPGGLKGRSGGPVTSPSYGDSVICVYVLARDNRESRSCTGRLRRHPAGSKNPRGPHPA